MENCYFIPEYSKSVCVYVCGNGVRGNKKITRLNGMKKKPFAYSTTRKITGMRNILRVK